MRMVLSWLLVGLLAWQGLLPALALAAGPEPERQGRVTADRLNVRDGPATTNAVVGAVTKGEVIAILEGQTDWLKVRLADGTIGWVAAKYVEDVAAPPAGTGEEEPTPAPATPAPAIRPASSRGGGGGSALGTIFKWTCFVGAAATGYLAYNEHTSGNDSYDEYKAMVLEQGKTPADAEFKRTEATDHDGKAQTFMLASGVLFGAFLIQQFLLGGGDDQAMRPSEDPLPLAWDPIRGEVRASIVLARF